MQVRCLKYSDVSGCHTATALVDGIWNGTDPSCSITICPSPITAVVTPSMATPVHLQTCVRNAFQLHWSHTTLPTNCSGFSPQTYPVVQADNASNHMIQIQNAYLWAS